MIVLINISITFLFNFNSFLFKILTKISFISSFLKLNFIPFIKLFKFSFFLSINCTHTNNAPKILINSFFDIFLSNTFKFKKLII